jgi:hypothetical protein
VSGYTSPFEDSMNMKEKKKESTSSRKLSQPSTLISIPTTSAGSSVVE